VGSNEHILSERAIEPALYSDWPLTIELRENFHLHYRNWRPVVNKEQFLKITDAFAEARRKYDELGQPEKDEHGPTLGEVKLSPPLHQNRLAVELCTDGTVHFHFDDMRLHMDQRTFFRMGLVFREALQEFCRTQAKAVKISECEVGDIVRKVYLPWLEEYIEDMATPGVHYFPQSQLGDLVYTFLEAKNQLRPEDQQRYSRGWLKRQDGSEYRTRPLPEEMDRRLLYAIYESIKEYGYGEGPYQHDYIRAHPFVHDENKLFLTGSHRVACLIALGYDEIKVVETN